MTQDPPPPTVPQGEKMIDAIDSECRPQVAAMSLWTDRILDLTITCDCLTHVESTVRSTPSSGQRAPPQRNVRVLRAKKDLKSESQAE